MVNFRWVGVFVFLMILAVPLSARAGEPFPFPEPPIRTDDPLWDRAAALWRERDQLKKLEEVRELFQSLSTAHPDQIEPELWLGRVNYYLGIYFDNRKKRAHFLRESVAHLENVLARDSENIYAQYWLGAAWGAESGEERDFSRLKALAEKYPPGREFAVPGDIPEWKEAMKVWDARADLARAREAVAVWEEIAWDNPESFEAFGWLARAHYWLGENEETGEGKERIFYRGYEYGERALTLRPRDPGAHFWTGANLARYTQQGSIARQARFALKIFGHVSVAQYDDPLYYHGGVFRYITYCLAHAGALTRKVLALAGFDIDLIQRLYPLALAIAPNYLDSYMAYAEYAISVGDFQAARRALDHVLVTPADSMHGFVAENLLCRKNAAKLLNTLKE